MKLLDGGWVGGWEGGWVGRFAGRRGGVGGAAPPPGGGGGARWADWRVARGVVMVSRVSGGFLIGRPLANSKASFTEAVKLSWPRPARTDLQVFSKFKISAKHDCAPCLQKSGIFAISSGCPGVEMVPRRSL